MKVEGTIVLARLKYSGNGFKELIELLRFWIFTRIAWFDGFEQTG